MATTKIHTTKDLAKMSTRDRLELLQPTLATLAHQRLRVRTQEDKQSHKVNAYKKQVARIKTFNKIAQDEK
jgi:ribosomal protein L29